MAIRVTVGSSQTASLAGLQAASQQLATLQEQLSTGQQISRPSDDPAGTVRALELRGDLKRNAQYARSSADAAGWLSTADTAYGQITDLVQRVRTLTVQGLNSGASTGASAKAVANEIASIREAAVKLANASYNGQPVFGGTTIYGQPGGPSAPFEVDGSGAVVYRGDENAIFRTIGDHNRIQINQTGSQALGADGSNLFDLMDRIITSLTTDGVPEAGQLTEIDDAIGRLSSARAASGASLARVEAAQDTQATDKISLKTNLSQIQDIDLAEVAIQVNTAKVVYQAALQTTANIRQMSLLDFLR